MIPAIFSTTALPEGEQLDAWRGWFEGIYDVDIPEGARGFPAGNTHWMLGGLTFGRVFAPALRATRTSRQIRHDPADHWVIAVGTRAPTRLLWRDAVLTLPAEIPFVSSLADPITSERPADERLHLYLPRDRFAAMAPILDAARGGPVNGPLGSMLRDYLILLEGYLPSVTGEDLPRLTEAVRAMVAACVAPSRNALALAGEQISVVKLERARQVIRRCLRSARLGPSLLCHEVGISRSQLYRMFEAEGGVVRYIQRCRLLAAHAALSDASETRPIAAIGEAFGFYDASTFSRAFRREFGVSPGEVRAGEAAAQRARRGAGAQGLPARVLIRWPLPSTVRMCRCSGEREMNSLPPSDIYVRSPQPSFFWNSSGTTKDHRQKAMMGGFGREDVSSSLPASGRIP